MEIIKTPSFELATISAGDPHSQRTALLIPGRLDTKDYVNFVSHMDCLARLGYYAIAYDPPGTWESPGEVEYTTTNLIKTVNELIGYLGNRPTLLLGHSRGGQIASLVGAAHHAVTSLVLVNASYGPPSPPNPRNIHDGYLMEYRDIPPGDRKTEQQREFRLSLNYFADGAQYDPLPRLKSCNKPKLLIVSTDDEWTKPDTVKRVYDAIPEPKMFYEMSGHHDYRRDANAIHEVNTMLETFVQQYHAHAA